MNLLADTNLRLFLLQSLSGVSGWAVGESGAGLGSGGEGVWGGTW